MPSYEIGMRKYEDSNKVKYWLAISGRDYNQNEKIFNTKVQSSQRKWCKLSLNYVNNVYWKVFILVTILINILITINLFPLEMEEYLIQIAVLVHATCFVFWIDFVGACWLKVRESKRKTGVKTRSAIFLLIEAISLLPLSVLYLISVRDPDMSVFWWLRAVTLLRFYRFPVFLSKLAVAGRSHVHIFVSAYIFYLIIFIDFFANVWITRMEGDNVPIYNWNETVQHRLIVALYFSVAAILNTGYGDIVAQSYVEMLMVSTAIVIGFAFSMGVFVGALATEYTKDEKKREIYRREYEAFMKILKDRDVDKKIINQISRNLLKLWKCKKGISSSIPIHILPVSLQKEMYFDVNFGLLNRSLIFSRQPRSFLRSVALRMKNMSFLPGEVISEPSGMTDAMICVASGVIEILSEENDETTLFSLTTGSIVGEANLFMSVPARSIIRASTQAELQILNKVHFYRLALNHPDIYQSMRQEVLSRIIRDQEPLEGADKDDYEIARKKVMKHLLQEMRRRKKENKDEEHDHEPTEKSVPLSLYVISENIPRVKSMPIALLRSRPWILRPESPLMDIWNFFIVFVVSVVVFVYPYLAGFVRGIHTTTYVLLITVQAIYIVDVYIQCTTAIERKDHFTYITSLKGIISYKLKTVGFYVDVLAAYPLTVYSSIMWPRYPEYAYLILSLNKMLKFWQVPRYFITLENNLNTNLLLIRAMKYLYYFSMTTLWVAVAIYLEACPVESCIEERWFAVLEKQEVEGREPAPKTAWPPIVSLYGACSTVTSVGAGDVSARALPDCLVFIFGIVCGMSLLCFCLAQASATFKHLARVRTSFQEQVFAVDRFMKEHKIPEDLRSKVRNYFRLQWVYDKGFSLTHTIITEAFPIHQRQILLAELMKVYLTVPLFREAESDFLRLLAKSSKVRVLSPNETITNIGSFYRNMYVIEDGFCEVISDGARKLIGPVTPFGYLEMVLGLPLNIRTSTLTHVRLVSLDYQSYLRAVTQFPSVKYTIDESVDKEMYTKPVGYSKSKFAFFTEEDDTDEEILERQRELRSAPIINVYRYHQTLPISYWYPFRAWGKLRFLQFFVLPLVIQPDCLFLKIWVCLRIISTFLIGLLVPLNFSLRFYMQDVNILVNMLQSYIVLDMYLMFHVGYYDHRGILMFHPAKTATRYLRGTFILDVFLVFPYSLLIELIFPRTETTPSIFYDAPGLIMVLQFYKFFQGCFHLQTDILRRMETINVLKFLPMTMVTTNFVTGLLILLECYSFIPAPDLILEKNSVREEYRKSIAVVCTPSNASNTFPPNSSPLKLYLLTYYWVTSNMVTCGFGDLTAYNKTTMIATILIIILGIFLYGYMFAVLTSSLIAIHNSVAKYRRRIREMIRFMKMKQVDQGMQTRLTLHYEYNWWRTEGTRPQKMFSYVHSALREDLVAGMYEATIRQVPAFFAVEKSVVRAIGRYLDEIYFLVGETIVKYNDVQEYMYLIYRGRVDVLTKDEELITTMGSGGMFGNISNKPFSLSSVVVVARMNVDLLRLDTRLFFRSLQIFSNTRSLVDMLASTTEDYIEPLRDGRPSNVLRTTSQIDTIPFEITTIRMVRPTIDISLLDLNAKHFHFFNSIYKHPKKNVFSFVILPDSSVHKGLGVTVCIMAYLSSILTLYTFAFQDFHFAFIVPSYFLDLMFFFYIVLQFHYSFYNKYGDYVVNTDKIKKRYLNSKLIVTLDITANMPLDVFAAISPGNYIFVVLSILRLNRILRLCYVFQYYNVKFKYLMVNKIYLELSWAVVCISLMIHFFACVWYFIACPFNQCQNPSWVIDMGKEQESKHLLYLTSIYYIVSVTTTTGFGDVPVRSTLALLAGIVFMIISGFGVVLLTGSTAAVINVHSLNLFLYQERISELKASFLHQRVSEYQIAKMWNYVTSLWMHETGKQIPKFISNAPYVMRCEVMNAMYGMHLSQSYIFSDIDEAFVRQLAIYLRRFVFFPGNYITQQGDIDHSMYFIHKGEVSVLTIHPDLMETIHFTLIENDHFGLRQGLNAGAAHHFSYRAETEVEILSLTLNDWQHLLRYFPHIAEKLYQRIDALPTEESHADTSSPAPE